MIIAGATPKLVVLLHGLTDSPYSLRHVARRYVQAGYVAVAVMWLIPDRRFEGAANRTA